MSGIPDMRAHRVQLESFGVYLAYLFGSRGRGTERADSDVDVAVMAAEPLSLAETARLATLFSEAFGVAEVDVVDLRVAPLSLSGRIAQEGRLLFSSDEVARVRFEAETRIRYLDFLPMLQFHDRTFVESVAARGL